MAAGDRRAEGADSVTRGRPARQPDLFAGDQSQCPEPRCVRWDPKHGCLWKAEGRRKHPQWCYDLDRVRDVQCLACGEPIGDEPYVEDTALARFGSMLFFHRRCVRCVPAGDEEDEPQV